MTCSMLSRKHSSICCYSCGEQGLCMIYMSFRAWPPAGIEGFTCVCVCVYIDWKHTWLGPPEISLAVFPPLLACVCFCAEIKNAVNVLKTFSCFSRLPHIFILATVHCTKFQVGRVKSLSFLLLIFDALILKSDPEAESRKTNLYL